MICVITMLNWCCAQAKMSEMFFSPLGLKAFYVVICLYLYGDLCVYLTAIPSSLTSVVWFDELLLIIGIHYNMPSSSNTTNSSEHCMGTLTKKQSYYVFLVRHA